MIVSKSNLNFAVGRVREAFRLVIIFSCVASFLCSQAEAEVWYVNADNTSETVDGTSWSSAYKEIQPAIDSAFMDGGGEVWVSRGTYDETRASADGGALVLAPGVHVYGGFLRGETDFEDRDWERNVVIIDGFTARDGLPAYHVVIGVDDSILDGFTITGGMANGSASDEQVGAGVYNVGSSTIANCEILDNSAEASGAGMYNEESPTIRDCVFSNNSSVTLGGGMYNEGSPVIMNSFFFDNVAGLGGGGIYNRFSTATIENCLFVGNSGNLAGGGIVNSFSNVTITNCTFVDNSSRSGGGIANREPSTPVITNCIVWGNMPDAISTSESVPTVTYSIVEGGHEGMGNVDADPLFWHAAIRDFRLQLTSPSVNTGTATGAPVTDIDGFERPQGAEVDMGAYELVEDDSDADGIPDELEGTDDPDEDDFLNDRDTDSDGNGIPDAAESLEDTDLDETLDIYDLDDDDDGLTDLDELTIHMTDPKDEDSDGDLIPDGWEFANGIDPLVDDASEDPDGDGATNLQEFRSHTNPLEAPAGCGAGPVGSGTSRGADVLVVLFAAVLLGTRRRYSLSSSSSGS